MRMTRKNPVTGLFICDIRILFSVIFSVGYTLSSAKMRISIGEFIDQLSTGVSYEKLIFILMLASATAVAGYGMWKSSNSYTAKIQSVLYQKLISKTGDQPQDNGSNVGKITALMTQDIQAIVKCVQRILQKVIPDTATFIAAVSILGRSTHWSIAVIAVLLCLFQAAFTYAVNAKINAKRHLLQHILEDSMQDAFHGIENIEAIKAYGLEDSTLLSYKKALDNYNRVNIKVNRLTSLLFAASMFLSFLVMLWITVECGKLISAGKISIGTFFVAMTMIENLISPIMCLDRSVKIIVGTKVNMKRIHDYLIAPAQQPCGNSSVPKGDIVFQNVFFAYKGSEKIMDNISFQCRQGVVNYIVGKNGCGKSTIVKLLLKEEKTVSGNILVSGIDICALSQNELTQNIAVSTQDTVILPTTISNNLRLGAGSVTIDQIYSVCKTVGIHSEIEALPMKYDTVLHDNGEPLSLGQKKRIALARTLLRNTYVYIFDEPSAGLDFQNVLRIKKVFEMLSRDHIVIVITHDTALLEGNGNKITIGDGKE